MNISNSDDKELPPEKKTQETEDVISSQESLPKEVDGEKPLEKQEEGPLEKEIVEAKPQEETKTVLL
jgi:hypothetical protein